MMISRDECKLRKAIARRKIDNAILSLMDLKDLLDFNKRLRIKAIDVHYRLLLLHKTLLGEKA